MGKQMGRELGAVAGAMLLHAAALSAGWDARPEPSERAPTAIELWLDVPDDPLGEPTALALGAATEAVATPATRATASPPKAASAALPGPPDETSAGPARPSRADHDPTEDARLPRPDAYAEPPAWDAPPTPLLIGPAHAGWSLPRPAHPAAPASTAAPAHRPAPHDAASQVVSAAMGARDAHHGLVAQPAGNLIGQTLRDAARGTGVSVGHAVFHATVDAAGAIVALALAPGSHGEGWREALAVARGRLLGARITLRGMSSGALVTVTVERGAPRHVRGGEPPELQQRRERAAADRWAHTPVTPEGGYAAHAPSWDVGPGAVMVEDPATGEQRAWATPFGTSFDVAGSTTAGAPPIRFAVHVEPLAPTKTPGDAP